MNICIDMRPALSVATGVGTYLINLVKAFSEIDQQNEYHLFSSSWKERFSGASYGENFRIHDYHLPVRFLNYAWHRFSRPTIETLLRTSIDVAHSPTPLLIPSHRAHRVTMVHDLYFYFHPEHTAREIHRDYRDLVLDHCRQSDAIISVSEHTKEQLVEHLKIPASKVYTIRHGADSFYVERSPQNELDGARTKFGIRKPFFLFVGSLEPRKNLTTLLRAFDLLREDAELVLAGPESWRQDLKILPNERVIKTGYVSKQELRALYQQAVALVLPSLEEGFGLPLVEAMAARTPVLASDIPIFREIANDCFFPVSSNNVEELYTAMSKMYGSSEIRQRLVAKGEERLKRFSWSETAQKTLDIYRNL